MATQDRPRDGIGGFLRARRERLGPADVGLPVHERRRTRGLRREEVAVLAGISVDYYTRLEQGRDERPSPSIVRALASALRLTPEERTYLHAMAGIAESGRYAANGLRPNVHLLLDTLLPAPAYVVTPVGDFVGWNAATTVLWVDPSTLPVEERNLVRMILLDPRMRTLWSDWEAMARETVAYLRGASARFPGDPRLAALIDDLRAQSAEFRAWWSEHDVSVRRAPRKRFAHPSHGELSFLNETMELVGEGLLFMVFLPADETTAALCAAITGDRPPPRALRAVGDDR